LNYPVVTPSFFEERQGKLEMITVYAKKARGTMARFIIENQIENIEGLSAFDSDGYFFDNVRSTEKELVFVR